MKPIFLSCWLLIFSFTGFTQIAADTSIIVNDTLTEASYFSANVSYTTNNLGSKTKQDSTMAALLTDVSFYHKSGVYGSIMPSFYKTSGKVTYDVDLMAGYSKYYNSGFDFTTYYSYHFNNNDTLLSGINYKHSLNVSMGYFLENLYLFTDAYTLNGKTNNYFVEPGLGFYFEINELLLKNGYVSFFLMVMVSFGTDYWVYEDFKDLEYAIAKRYLEYRGHKIERFEYQSFNLTVPISYNYYNWSFTATYMYSGPSAKFKEIGWQNQSGMMFSLSYMLNL